MESQEKVRHLVRAALDKKALDPVIFQTEALTDLADYVVILSGSSDRHVKSVADAIDEALRKAGEKPLGMEGANEGRWVLIDAGDVVVHVFHKPVREYYDLERLWLDAPRYIPDLPEFTATAVDRAPEAGYRR